MPFNQPMSEPSNFSFKNRLILGDSSIVLSKLRQEKASYHLIMIDPPYNENKSKGKYQDLWKGRSEQFPWAGEKRGKYLDFLYDKMVLGKELLTEDGLLMLFIGDGEYSYIKVMMDMIFGEENYIGTLIWDSSSNQQKSKLIDRNHEYVMIYSKNIKEFSKLGLYKLDSNSYEGRLYQEAQSLRSNKLSYEENQKKYDSFYRGLAKEVTARNKNGEDVSMGNQKYISPDYIPFNAGDAGDPRNGSKRKLLHPITGNECPLPANGKGWRYSDEYLERIATSKNIYTMIDGRVLVLEKHDKKEDIIGILFGKDESGVPNTARVYSQKTDKTVMMTTGYSYRGDKKQGIDPKTGFETVKPVPFLVDILMNYPNKEARVLDFFGGSGTTAVAVNEANKEDQGKRSWILIEMNPETYNCVLIPKLGYFGITDYKKEES